MKPTVLIKGALAAVTALGFTVSANAGCGNGSLYCGSNGSTTMQPLSYASAPQYIPFSSTASTNGNISIAGLGANESLAPTSCPVDVQGLQSGQSVLGCYQVMKQNTSTVRYHYGAPNTVRVVRPIIYVRYPVPTPVIPVPVPVPTPVPGPVFGPGFGPRMCGGPMVPPPPPWMRGGCGW